LKCYFYGFNIIFMASRLSSNTSVEDTPVLRSSSVGCHVQLKKLFFCGLCLLSVRKSVYQTILEISENAKKKEMLKKKIFDKLKQKRWNFQKSCDFNEIFKKVEIVKKFSKKFIFSRKFQKRCDFLAILKEFAIFNILILGCVSALLGVAEFWSLGLQRFKVAFGCSRKTRIQKQHKRRPSLSQLEHSKFPNIVKVK